VYHAALNGNSPRALHQKDDWKPLHHCLLTVEVIVTMYANFSWSCVAWFICLRIMFIDNIFRIPILRWFPPSCYIVWKPLNIIVAWHNCRTCHSQFMPFHLVFPDFGPFKSHRLLRITDSSTLKLNHLFGLPCRTIVSKLIWIHMMLVLLLVLVHCQWNFVAILFSLMRDTM
jgi:hypothetical protein